MILDVIQVGDTRLHKRSAEVTVVDKEIKQLIEDMIDTMYAYNGIGLAAVQVGELKRIFVIDIEDMTDGPTAYINPVIISVTGELDIAEEGCLSIAKVTGEVERRREVHMEYTDINNKKQTLKAEDLLARCILHENDHLNGKLFIDYATTKAEKEEYNRQLVENNLQPYFKL